MAVTRTYDLEPAVAVAVKQGDALYPRPPEAMSPAEVRAAMAEAPAAPAAVRPSGLSVTDESLPAQNPARAIKLRRYRPASAQDTAIVYFHGGGWTLGGLDSHDGACAALAAETGAEVVAVDYRKMPDHVFPAAFDDAVAVATAIGKEGRPVALAGDSSGANLALAAALALRGGALPGAALLLFYPIIGLDFETESYRENAFAPALTRARCQRIYSDYVDGDLDGVRARGDWRAAPLLARDFGDLPPAVIVVAEYDPLLSDGVQLGERLEHAGVPVTLIRAPKLPHGFIKWRGISPNAAATTAEATRALAALLSRP